MLAQYEVIVFCVLTNDAQRRVHKDGQNQSLKSSLLIKKKVKNIAIYPLIFCSFNGRVADIEAAESKARFRPFSKSTKMFYSKFSDAFFFLCGHIHYENTDKL